MYARHFDLTQDPFSIAPDPHFLFMSDRHREALAHLLYGVNGSGGGFVLLTGDIGTGKTTVCRCFLEQIPDQCNVALIFNPKLSVVELLESICQEFHVELPDGRETRPSVKDYVDALNAFLLQSHGRGQSNVLIIDEAQNLLPDVLEQLRLLTNLETSERKLLQIVLIGQPELRAMLDRPELEQLAQRVIARFHLDALSAVETTRYIAHRLNVAGLAGPLPFDEKALARIFQLTAGVPRRINLLCGRSLLGAWANGLPRVDRKVVEKAATEVFGAASGVSGARKSVLILAGGAVAVTAALVGMAWQGQRAPAASTASAPAPQWQQSASSPAAAPALPPVSAPLVEARAETRAPASSAPVAVAEVSTARIATPDPGEITALETLLPLMAHDLDQAWRELGQLWHLPLRTASPCQTAASIQLQCYHTSDLSVPLLRQLARPAILSLQAASEPPAYAIVTAVDELSATVRLGDASTHRISLSALGRLWRGDFSTYWRPPAQFDGELHDGASGPAVTQLADQLARLEGNRLAIIDGNAVTLDAALRARVRAFQRGQGLKPDGHPGPMTFMQLDRATGVSDPDIKASSP
jgi:general secretion pathway protein A